MKCSACKFDIDDVAFFCPQCGTRINREAQIAVPVQRRFSHDVSEFWPEWEITEQIMTDVAEVVYKAVKTDDGKSFSTIKVLTVSPETVCDEDSDGSISPDSVETICHNAVNCIMNEIRLRDVLRNADTIVNTDDFKIIEKTDECKWEIYIRMDYVVPFDLYICDKMLSEQEVIKLGCDICSALEVCEERKIIHSNINPGNITVDRNGTFLLDGFKAEKMFSGALEVGRRASFTFAAPEILGCIKYTSKVDTYSLGLLMYTLMNRNRIPFLSPTKQLLTLGEKRNAVRRRMEGELIPPPLDASEKLAEIILRACEFKPEDRFESATEMKSALIAISKNPYPPITEKTVEEKNKTETKNTNNHKRGIRRFFLSK